MDDKRVMCRVCRQRYPQHLTSGGLCYDCHLGELLPIGYTYAEDYQYDKIWGHYNATRRPKTGLSIFDDGPARLWQFKPE